MQVNGFKEFFQKIKGIKNIEIIGAVIIAVLILAIYALPGSSTKSDTKSETSDISNSTDQDASAEEKLTKILSGIEGAGSVEVMITYESSAELVTAQSVDKQTSTTTETDSTGKNKTSETVIENQEPVTVKESDGDSALILVEKEPLVRGVIIVAEGADDIGVKLDLLKAARTALQVSSDKVEVFVMNKNEE